MPATRLDSTSSESTRCMGFGLGEMAPIPDDSVVVDSGSSIAAAAAVLQFKGDARR